MGIEERARLIEYISKSAIDQKRSDAIEALTRVHDMLNRTEFTGKNEA